ncbi:MAG: hypothetical protein WBE74_12965 [Terracidiphilus sp.]
MIVEENRRLPIRIVVLVFPGHLDAVRINFSDSPMPVGDVGIYLQCDGAATSPRSVIRDVKIVTQAQLIQRDGAATPDLRGVVHAKNEGAAIVPYGNRFGVDRN